MSKNIFKLEAIIMAAGLGSRLGGLTKDTPKPLIKIKERAIIEYGINFLKLVGVKKIIIVGGYHFNKLKNYIGEIDNSIELIENKKYHLGNIYSLEKGLEKVNNSFILFHADHIYRKDIAFKIREQLGEKIIAFVDRDRKLSDDDMKVQVDKQGLILKKISKRLDNYSLGYVGITYCHKKFLDKYKKAVKKVKKTYGQMAVSENVMQYLVDNSLVNIYTGDISGFKWLEIDTPQDLEKSRKEIELNSNQYY